MGLERRVLLRPLLKASLRLRSGFIELSLSLLLAMVRKNDPSRKEHWNSIERKTSWAVYNVFIKALLRLY